MRQEFSVNGKPEKQCQRPHPKNLQLDILSASNRGILASAHTYEVAEAEDISSVAKLSEEF